MLRALNTAHRLELSALRINIGENLYGISMFSSISRLSVRETGQRHTEKKFGTFCAQTRVVHVRSLVAHARERL
jgi:hypothetical protein